MLAENFFKTVLARILPGDIPQYDLRKKLIERG